MARNEYDKVNGTSYYFKNLIYAGNTQHAAMLFPGSVGAAPFEIIGDERIALKNGFTLHEYYNQEKNLKPGSICSNVFESTLLNYDGALAGFNYERDFMLMLGVEIDQGTNVTWSVEPYVTPDVPGDYKERLVLNGFSLGMKQGKLTYRRSGEAFNRYITGSNYRHMFAIKGKETSATYYVYIVSDDGTRKYIDRILEVTNSVSTIEGDFATVSDYFYARLEALANQGACEVFSSGTWNSLVCEKYIVRDDTSVTKHTIIYENMCVLTGKQPKRSLGKIVEFSAVGVNTKLDADADSYANTEFSSSKTLDTIRQNLLNAVGLSNFSAMPGGGQVFTENPFMGLKGYTYRELLSYVGESVGESLKEGNRSIVLSYNSDGVPTKASISNKYDFFTSFNSRPGNAMFMFNRNEYYSYDAEEYTVSPIDVIVSKQTEDDVGTSYPVDPSGTNTLYILNNPLLNAPDVSTIQSRLSYVYSSLYGNASGNYIPAVIECPNRFAIEPGDVVKLFLEDGSYVWTPVFCITTTWNGSADCVMECTGDKTLDQYTQGDFRKTIKDGNKIHKLIVDIERVYSSIVDTLTTDYSTTEQVANAIALYVGNNAYEKVSGITINSDGVTVTGSKYVKLATSGYINLGGVGRVDMFGLRLKVSEDPNLYMRLGSTGGVTSSDVLNIGYEDFGDNVDALRKPSITIRTKKNPSAHETELNIYSATNPDANYDLITIAPWEYGQLGSSNRSYTGGRAWDYIYGNTINYVSLVQNSSRDIKHDISPLEEVGSLIDQLIPVSFVYNQDAQEKKHMGLIYEDTVGVLPGVCEGIESTDVERKTINYIELVPVLLKEIQSLRHRVSELETKNGQD